eukprot:4226537-Pyramimonas_sp.AAC.1
MNLFHSDTLAAENPSSPLASIAPWFVDAVEVFVSDSARTTRRAPRRATMGVATRATRAKGVEHAARGRARSVARLAALRVT